MAIAALAGTKHLVLAGAQSPVHFFGYPDVPGHPVPDDCTVHVLSEPGEDGVAALRALAERAAPDAVPSCWRPPARSCPRASSPPAMAAVIGRCCPRTRSSSTRR